jgi:hypothetical protein
MGLIGILLLSTGQLSLKKISDDDTLYEYVKVRTKQGKWVIANFLTSMGYDFIYHYY